MKGEEVSWKHVLASAVVAAGLTLTNSCAPPNPVMSREFGDGTWNAGEQIRPGTYRTANVGPHEPGKPCTWTVTKESNKGKVLLKDNGDTGEKIQEAYVDAGEVIFSNNCGTWGWVSRSNETQKKS